MHNLKIKIYKHFSFTISFEEIFNTLYRGKLKL